MTICVSGAGDIPPKQSDLCVECFEASNPAGVSGITKAIEAGCRYCGGPFHIGGGDPLATLSGARKMRCLCKRCAEEYHGFLGRELPGFGNPDITKEQIDQIRTRNFAAILTELEAHMKKWVAGRDDSP
jgi:hypothetical protein